MKVRLEKNGICVRCGKEYIIYYNKNLFLCRKCVRSEAILRRLTEQEKNIVPLSNYNRYLFDLYLKYVQRFTLNYDHVSQAKRLKAILESRPLPQLCQWNDLYQESKNYKALYGRPPNSGCPFIKIGHMLQELGVLPPKAEETGHYFERLFGKLSEDSLSKIKPFVDYLLLSNRASLTIIRTLEILIQFNVWMTNEFQSDLLTANALSLQKYLNHITNKGLRHSLVIQIYTYLNTYYRWCENKKMIFVNPCTEIMPNKMPERITICSEAQCEKLFAFIKNQKSNPEQALAISLILIWGLTSEDLRFAQIEFNNNSMALTLRRKLLRRKHRYYREQILALPINPEWFYRLQQRFYRDWLAQYDRLKKTYPHHYLMLPKSRFVRPLTKGTLLSRIYEGTIAAVGERIPTKVLRQTCGHLQTVQNDASILSRLGWSSEYCFDYTWRPRNYFTRTN